MSDLDCSSKHLNTNSCYSRRLEEVFTEDYPTTTKQDRNIKPGSEKNQNQSESQSQVVNDAEIVEGDTKDLSKINTRIQDCGLNRAKSEQAEQIATQISSGAKKVEPSKCSE